MERVSEEGKGRVEFQHLSLLDTAGSQLRVACECSVTNRSCDCHVILTGEVGGVNEVIIKAPLNQNPR